MLWTPASKWKTDCYTHIHFKSQVKTWTEFKANLMYQKETKQWLHKLVQILIDIWMFLTSTHKKKYGCRLQTGSEKAMAPHSSTLAWKIPWTEEPGRLQSMESWRVGHDWATSLSLFTFMHWRRKWKPTPVFLPGESQGLRSPWTAIYGITQSRTQLKRLSSSSNQDILFTLFQCSALCYCLLSYSPFHSVSPKKI